MEFFKTGKRGGDTIELNPRKCTEMFSQKTANLISKQLFRGRISIERRLLSPHSHLGVNLRTYYTYYLSLYKRGPGESREQIRELEKGKGGHEVAEEEKEAFKEEL